MMMMIFGFVDIFVVPLFGVNNDINKKIRSMYDHGAENEENTSNYVRLAQKSA